MIRLRGPALLAAVLVGILVILVGLACTSGMQTWIARRVLAAQPDWTGSIDQVTARPGRVDVRGLVLSQPGLEVRVPVLTADVSLWKLLRGELVLNRVEARQWTVNYNAAAVAAPAVARHEAPPSSPPHLAGWVGWLATANPAVSVVPAWTEYLRLPMAVSVGDVQLQGRVLWTGVGAGADGHANVTLTGGGLGASTSGRFDVQIAAESGAEGERALQSLEVASKLEVSMVEPDRIGRLGLTSQLTARRHGVAEANRFQLDLALDGSAAAPQLDVSLRDEQQPLIGARLALHADQSLAGTWSVMLSDGSVRSLLLGTALPAFTAQGQGTLSAAADGSTLAVDGLLRFAVDGLETVQAELAAIDAFSGSLEFAVQKSGQDLRCTRLELALDAAEPVMRVRLLQGVEFAAGTFEVRVAAPADPVLALDLLGLPVSWAAPWLGELTVSAQPVVGKFLGVVTPHGLSVVAVEPLRVGDLAVTSAGQPLLDGARVEVSFGAEVTNAGWQVELDRLELADAAGAIVTIGARGGRLVRENDLMKLAGRVQVDLAGLMRTSALRGKVPLTGGRLEGEFGVGSEERVSVAVALGLSDLATADGMRYPHAQFDGRLDLLADGSIEAHLPMKFTQEERVSDLTLNLRAQPQGEGWRSEGSLSGPQAFLADLQLLAAPFAVAEAVGDEAATARPGPTGPAPSVATTAGPKRSPWHGFSGAFQTAIGRLVLPDGFELTNVRGDVVVTEEAVTVDGLRAGVGAEGQVTVQGRLGFGADAAKPYAAEGKFEATAIEVGPLLRALQPATPPPLEGKFDVAADWSSTVAELTELAGNGALNARVSSTGGVLRALGVKVDDYVKTGRTVSALGGLLALATGNTQVQEYSNRVQAATAVAERLSRLTFDQLNLEVSKQPLGDIVLSDLSLISPGFRLLGKGRISHGSELPFWQQPLAAQLQLAARDDFADYLKTLKLLQTEADALGYLPFVRDVSLDGSLASVGTAELQRLISRALSSP